MARTFSPRAGVPRRLFLALLHVLSASLCVAAEPRPPVTIFPTADLLPANHLKFYLHFREPMREGVFLEYCSLLDARGKPVLEPFRETELWSNDRRRLTLWLHPGRQKEGVNLNVEFGPVLEPGRRYTLRISGAWLTAAGSTLGRDAKKTFRTSARRTAQLDATEWKITAPHAGTREPLQIRFPDPLDHALVTRCLRVADAGLKIVSGRVATADGEQCWRFTPDSAWTGGEHRVLVEAVLEDLSGNSLARPFEVDLHGPSPRKVLPSVALTFQPRL